MGSGSHIDDFVESGTVQLLDWNDSMTDIQLGMRFVDKVQAVSAVLRLIHGPQDVTITVTIITVHEITRFVKEHTCLVQIEQNKHRNLSSKFISMSISHLVANDPEIPVSNIIQEVQVLFQTGSNFHPVLSENFWRDVPFNLTFYPPNMKKERGRKQGKQFQGEMDYRNPNSPLRCGRCRMPGHNRKNCNNHGPGNV
ncbi:hypothetical protein M9H77_24020 [Catharanthus roseus]|uniref:Uncharacterized protein n=1 Tax=Catharanthus roseus TaxID=4058 RepID=A0ACC0AXG7_CATRO|nr:hypothetical protein M9H77_24020 [Catharanthus roseus]